MKKEEVVAQEVTKILASAGILSPAVAEQVAHLFKDSAQEYFTDFIITEGFVQKRDLLSALSTYYQVPWFDVQGYFFEHMLVHMFPKDFLLRNNIIPVEVDEDVLLVVASDPNDTNLVSGIGEYGSWDVQFNVGLKRDINDAVKEFYDEPVTQVEEDQDLEAERRVIHQEEEIEERGDNPNKEE